MAMQQFSMIPQTVIMCRPGGMPWKHRKRRSRLCSAPIENSSAGIVSENYDLLVEYDNCIVGEQIIPIDHCLLGTKGSKLSDIEQVYSHPQALMQCGRYLDEHRNWENTALRILP